MMKRHGFQEEATQQTGLRRIQRQIYKKPIWNGAQKMSPERAKIICKDRSKNEFLKQKEKHKFVFEWTVDYARLQGSY